MIPLNQNLNSLTRSTIRVYTALAKSISDCVSLAIGEPDFDTPENIKAAALAALRENKTHYAPNQGTEGLRSAIAEKEGVSPSRVLVTVGACQALFTALFGILNPGEEIIVPAPGFVLYESIAAIAGAKVVKLDISRTDFQITKEALASAITPRTKAILLNSPNNPTGVILNQQSLDNVAQAILGKPIFLVLDEVYNKLAYGPCPSLWEDPRLEEQTILCQSFSKPWAMTGWRIGYLVCPDYVMDRLLLLSAANITAVPTFLQEAAVTALDTPVDAMVEVYRQRRDYVCSRLTKMGLTFPKPEGAFYVFPNIQKYGLTSGEFCTRMIKEAGLAAVPGSCFGVEGYIRLSYCYSDEELREGLNRLETFIKTHCTAPHHPVGEGF